MFPEHYFHPLIIHFPLVLPFLILLLLLLTKERTEESQRVVIFLSVIQLLLSVAAFYSGQWASDNIGPQLSGSEIEVFDLHSIMGRVHLWISGLLAIAAVIKKIATKNQKLFSNLYIFLLIALMIISLISGYTGGRMVHEFGVNRYLIEIE